jgi:hypothetical protein
MNHHPAQKHLAAACAFVGVLGESSELRARVNRTRAALSAAAALLNDDQWPEHKALDRLARVSDSLKRLELLVNGIELDLCDALTESRQARSLDSETWGEA